MSKKLLKKCQKPVLGERKEIGMLIVGREMFEKTTPKINIPMYKLHGGKFVK